MSNQKMREALEIAVRQNEHDMLMTGEELRKCREALAADRAGRAEPVAHVWLQPQDLPWMIESLKMARLLVKREPRNEEIEKVQHALEVELMNLPSTPPAAPVVPEDMSPANVPMYWRDESSNACAYAAGFNACRRAMLAAAHAPSQEPTP